MLACLPKQLFLESDREWEWAELITMKSCYTISIENRKRYTDMGHQKLIYSNQSLLMKGKSSNNNFFQGVEDTEKLGSDTTATRDSGEATSSEKLWCTLEHSIPCARLRTVETRACSSGLWSNRRTLKNPSNRKVEEILGKVHCFIYPLFFCVV